MKDQSYILFQQKINQLAEEKKLLLRVMFELTYACNFKCKHCYVPPDYKKKYKSIELKTKEVFSILRQLKEAGCFYLGFTGGETFLRKDIIEILDYAKQCGFEVIVYTNGSLINEKIACRLANLRLNKIDITIPAMSREAFKQITGKDKARDKVFGAVEFLREQGINPDFKSCLLKDNQQEMGKIKEFTRHLHSRHRLDDLLFPRLDGSKIPYKCRGIPEPNPAEKRLTVSKRKKTFVCSTNSQRLIPKPRLFSCGAGRTQAAITPAGELKLCLMIDEPKYRILNNEDKAGKTESRKQIIKGQGKSTEKMGLRGAWKELKVFAESIKPDDNYQCSGCELRAYCCWCPARAWLKNRTFTSCDLACKDWAQTKRLELCPS